jgi:hypothetical protein
MQTIVNLARCTVHVSENGCAEPAHAPAANAHTHTSAVHAHAQRRAGRLAPQHGSSGSLTSLPMSQHTAENSFQRTPPSTAALALVQLWYTVPSDASGSWLTVPCPTENSRTSRYAAASAAAISADALFMPAMDSGVYIMLLWPYRRESRSSGRWVSKQGGPAKRRGPRGRGRTLQKKTSPNATSLSVASPSDELKNSVSAALLASVGGSVWRQTPAASVDVAASLFPRNVVCTSVPGVANPHTTAEAGARCKTTPSEKTLERRSALAAAVKSSQELITASKARQKEKR